MFQEPEGFFPEEKQPTKASYQMMNGTKLELRMVGFNALWGHHLWQGARRVSRYLEEHLATFLPGKAVLELGAGAGLPSLVCAKLGAKAVIVTDYPDADLVENLALNVKTLSESGLPGTLHAEGFLWGADPSSLLAHIPQATGDVNDRAFDMVLLADLLFNHSEHHALLKTVQSTLRRGEGARALVFFSPYRPWLLQKDLAFFELAKQGGLKVTKVGEWVEEKVMFEEDRGDELLRRTVFGYELSWDDVLPQSS
ncbi:hypothetical protein P152DRAFT_391790 [Eremomyces bilateralis CBS 781.70]|uniref:Protein N-terminal and lysine N-methyltransferase EFM7 n=1 Tax=Eremomyces bilateralis CBS 781.70 TaxID=1392243 RepID=A0A6G1GAG3_9PEZI|nr:uncharacterized protein P152DRAFT_391790 [Eremomyces bilateralis CBS 781.70]KAF1815023.1 hypothetical protein P152DRAFT_391790 [Eremomyces bilateralis CBS 781.70]